MPFLHDHDLPGSFRLVGYVVGWQYLVEQNANLALYLVYKLTKLSDPKV